MPKMLFNLSEDVRKELEKESQKRGVSMTHIVESLLRDYYGLQRPDIVRYTPR